MAISPYATADEVAARLGRALDLATETPKVEALILDVSSLVSSFCRRDFSADIPGDVKAIVISEVIRLINSNPGISVEDVGEVRIEYAASTGGLSRTAKDALRKYRPRFFSSQVESWTWQ